MQEPNESQKYSKNLQGYTLLVGQVQDQYFWGMKNVLAHNLSGGFRD
jgi:hypothetical protein